MYDWKNIFFSKTKDEIWNRLWYSKCYKTISMPFLLDIISFLNSHNVILDYIYRLLELELYKDSTFPSEIGQCSGYVRYTYMYVMYVSTYIHVHMHVSLYRTCTNEASNFRIYYHILYYVCMSCMYMYSSISMVRSWSWGLEFWRDLSSKNICCLLAAEVTW